MKGFIDTGTSFSFLLFQHSPHPSSTETARLCPYCRSICCCVSDLNSILMKTSSQQAQCLTALIPRSHLYNHQKHQKAAHGWRGTVLCISSQTKSGSSLQGVRLRNLYHLLKDMFPVLSLERTDLVVCRLALRQT